MRLSDLNAALRRIAREIAGAESGEERHDGILVGAGQWYSTGDGGGGLMAGYYVYNLIDADGVVRYVGKGTGRRIDTHLGVILALAVGAPATRASKVHRRFAADIQIGRQFRAVVVADRLSQADAYAMEARLITKHRRETEGGTLWNVLAGGEGFQGILHDDWILVARQAAATKKLSGSGLRAGAKAAAMKALTGAGLRAGAKAAATKLKRLQRPPPG